LDLAAETRAAFGDRRLQHRAAKLGQAWAEHGEMSFPKLLGAAGAEALYRFVNHDACRFPVVVEPHHQRTAGRAADCSGVIFVAHDSTGIEVPLHGELHCSVAFAFDQAHTPLGALAVQPFVHREHLRDNEAAVDYWFLQGGLYESEQSRWIHGIERAAARLGPKAKDAVHVMDREGDDYGALCWLQHCGHRFVQRANVARRFVGAARQPIDRALDGQAPLAKVTAQLGARTAARSAKAKETHPDRKARLAHLTIRAGTVEVFRPKNTAADAHLYASGAPLPASIRIGLCDVREEHPPAGEKPVRWLLLTTEPLTTAAEALTAVELYRSRWGIEVFFKVLKTGLRIEERQLESADSMLAAIALALPVATQVLRLRHMADLLPGALWSTVLTAAQFAVLKHKFPKQRLGAKSTVDDVKLAVALLGGFLKSNKTPGWQVLYGGWERLEILAEGYAIARG
jgi:hypothetical protein